MSFNELFLDHRDVILASASPRRKQILEKVDLDFQVKPSSFEEENHPNKSPSELVSYNSKMKCWDIGEQKDNSIIIGADTIVVQNNRIFEKPDDYENAFQMLKTLSNSSHKVLTGFTILDTQTNREITRCEETRVHFYELSSELIEYYLTNYRYKDKAGSYAIQDFSSIFVEYIEGCYYNVMGFPVSAFTKVLRDDL